MFFCIGILLLHMALLTSCNEKDAPVVKKESNGTVLMLLGSKISYWEQIYLGAKIEAEKHNYKIEAVFRDADTVNTSILNAIATLSRIPDLKGIIMMPGDKSVENQLIVIDNKIKLVIVDQNLNENSPLQPLVKTTVATNNMQISQDFSKKIPEKKILSLCYPIGGSYDRSVYLQKTRGKSNVDLIVISDANNARIQLEEYIKKHKNENFAVAFSTGSFINDETMQLIKGRKVYATDFGEKIKQSIENGEIEFTAIQSTFDMGAKAFKSIITEAPVDSMQYISIVYVTKDNVNSEEVLKFLE